MLSIYLMIGVAAGLASGLFGIGGGIVVIPALAAIFSQSTIIPVRDVMQMAVGTSLAIMIVTSASSLYAYHKNNHVRWDYFSRMVPGLAIGTVVGALIAQLLSSEILKIIFAIFLFYIGTRFALGWQSKEVQRSFSVATMHAASALIGGLSSILGVGGGSLIVPFLLRCQLDMHEATGTSVACGLIVGIVATVCFMMTGLFFGTPVLLSTGYIYWPAFLSIAVTSVLLAPLGAVLACNLPKEILKRIFGVFLLVMACDMLFFAR